MGDTEVKLPELPPCDFCASWGRIREAHYDGKTAQGPWAYMCESHFKLHGIGLGLGKGQRLIVEKSKE